MKKNYKKYYMGLTGVRNAGYKQPLTEDQVKEIIRCASDPIYFIEKYIKIVGKPDDNIISKISKCGKKKKKGLIPFILRDYQKNLIEQYYKYNRFIVKFPRQSGKSTTLQAIVVHRTLFSEFRNVAVLANKDRSAKKFLGKVKLMIKHLPFWLQNGVKTWNKTEIEFDNGSTIASAATSADGIRGDTCDDIICDEMAFVENNMWDDFYASVYPTVASDPDSKITLISTPNGLNHFYKFWTEAIQKISTYIPLEIKWNDIPGRDETYKINTIADIGQKKWDAEYDCLSGESIITLKNNQDEIFNITLLEFYELLKYDIENEYYGY